ncbi:polysaccharide deacetylase family protein [Salinimonas lutimaris]|uniref:polysaccharide deacetylase family protein n=1 Tax=Salinimonas lutimaris TaxID=914153 RepID=UPI0010C0CD87|nr:polysaccharide deacetylase family protein [Salinimonas lutimaris]
MIKPFLKFLMRGYASTIGWQSIKKGDKKLIVLMYHRVLPKDDNRYQFEEPGMVVSEHTFAMHMRMLNDMQLPVVLASDWVTMSDEERPQVAVAITFDDGWLDNYQFAFPVLKQYEFPSTLFVVSDFLNMPAPFWPNKVLRLLLTPGLKPDNSWHALMQLTGPIPRLPLTRDAAASVIDSLKHYGDDDIYKRLKPLAPLLEKHTQTEMISQAQLTYAMKNYGVELGCHTRRHYRLVNGLSEELLQEEIIGSKQKLELANNVEIKAFCFPNGDFSAQAHAMVKKHYQCAVTTMRGINTNNSDVSKLVRIGVHDDISNTPMKFKAKLAGFR